MTGYPRMRVAIQRTVPQVVSTPVSTLALSVSALLAKRTQCLTALARGDPRLDPPSPSGGTIAGSRSRLAGEDGGLGNAPGWPIHLRHPIGDVRFYVSGKETIN